MYFYKLSFSDDDDFALPETIKSTYFFHTYSFQKIKEIVMEAMNIKTYPGKEQYAKEWRNTCKEFLSFLRKNPPTEKDYYWAKTSGGNRSVQIVRSSIPDTFDD